MESAHPSRRKTRHKTVRTYPTKREVGKIIDSKSTLGMGYISSLEGTVVEFVEFLFWAFAKCKQDLDDALSMMLYNVITCFNISMSLTLR